jgi:cytochrome P450
MKQTSIFVNDSREVLKVFHDFPSKGRLYGAFRFNPEVPDILACDGDAFKVRKEALQEAFQNMKIPKNKILSLIDILHQAAESSKPIDTKQLAIKFGFDIICQAAFNYDLQAIEGSEQGEKLYQSIDILTAAQQNNAIYTTAYNRTVTKEETDLARQDWRVFLQILVDHVQNEGKLFVEQHHDLLPKEYVAHALYKLFLDYNGIQLYGIPELQSEIHQILRHGHECIGGTVMWMIIALHRSKRVRLLLEQSIHEYNTTNQPIDSTASPSVYPEYLQCFLKELFRR